MPNQTLASDLTVSTNPRSFTRDAASCARILMGLVFFVGKTWHSPASRAATAAQN